MWKSFRKAKQKLNEKLSGKLSKNQKKGKLEIEKFVLFCKKKLK